jgi:hypothetical protein
MDYSQLPYELQFQYLFPLSYEQVINYCQTNSTVNQICKDPEFWKNKALNNFNISLDLISAPNPSIQYAILENIMTGSLDHWITGELNRNVNKIQPS